ncbi:uncharacterized protein LOC121627579 [Chelmon rostratus]|uniref:uncharacterized protein LOC121627579 n=1 Tax=Chelmon rostratus TaxID=109905 RepID=UPI001BE5F544|nr:uncharacterized protein LOC121627579 [Chelmon rostratus]
MESGCSLQLNTARMAMKMAAVSTAALLLLCCSVFASKGSKDGCDFSAATNDNFTVPLHHALQSTEHLRWAHDQSIIFDRRPNKLVRGKEDDIFKNGSLKLTNLDKSKAGRYTPEVFTADGKAIVNLKSTRLCVFERVPRPEVTFECVQSSRSVRFTCTAGQPNKGLSIEWLQDGKALGKTKSQTLVKTAEDLKKHTFSCKVSNSYTSLISEPVQHNCTKPGFVFPDKLLGINSWIVVGCGGGVVLMLIVIIIVCCICNRRKKRMRLKDEDELRLTWTHTNQQHRYCHPPDQQQHHHHHHHHHQHQHQQQPAGHTGPRQHRSKQPCNQQRPRAPDQASGQPQPSPRRPAQNPRPAHTTDDEQPPPLPQPRKKAPKTPRV